MDVPGIPLSDIQVEMSEDDVTVSGLRSRDARERDDAWCCAERAYGRFVRVIPLPEGAWPEKALATLGDGVLEIRLPVTSPERRVAPALGTGMRPLAVTPRRT
jgi:HSP20 family protein